MVERRPPRWASIEGERGIEKERREERAAEERTMGKNNCWGEGGEWVDAQLIVSVSR